MSKGKKTSKTQSDALLIALESVVEFIKLISLNTDEFSGSMKPAFFFSRENEGGLFLDDTEAKQYRKSLNLLIDAVSNEQISAKTIEQLYQKAILITLDIRGQRKNQPFEERLNKEIQNLKSALRVKPYPFQVYYPVEGLTQDGLPLTFGNVTFCFLTAEEAYKLTQGSGSQQLSTKEQELPKSFTAVHEMLQDGLVGRPLGIVTVLATEGEAARTLALKELRLTLDILNFFSDSISFSNGCFFFLPGDRSRVVTTSFVTSGEGKQNYFISSQVVGPISPLSAKMLENINQIAKIGLAKASQLLIERNGNLQERLLSALQWAGRATTDNRKEEAFLLYAIALESLVLADNDKEELLYRLRTRVAHLIGESVQSRKQLSKQVKDLYTIRSQIVHSGKYQVTDADFEQMRLITKGCIIRVLTDTTFISLRSVKDFIEWFDDHILN